MLNLTNMIQTKCEDNDEEDMQDLDPRKRVIDWFLNFEMKNEN